MEEELYRSRLVEKFCPYTGKKALGLVTVRLKRDTVAGRWEEEVFRAQCLHRENCQDLGCEKGFHPFRP